MADILGSDALPEAENVEPDNVPDYAPVTFSLIRKIQDQASKEALLVLIDSGSTDTWINRRCLPKGATPSTVEA